MNNKYPAEFLARCKAIKAKRPKTVVRHLLKYGSITTEDLQTRYGYEHPPRAIRDVKEYGIALDKTMVAGANGRRIARYTLAPPEKQRILTRHDGRTGLSKALKDALVAQFGCKCAIYCEPCDYRSLQIDHRVPYEIAGESATMDPADFMLLSASANRAKSWSCEHCSNWQSKDKSVCLSCYWAYPEKYSHVATVEIRRLDLIWSGDEIAQCEQLKKNAASAGMDIPEFVKSALRPIIAK